mgnify:CR=1 FL=1|jgi:hypothetical protein
MSTFEQTTNPTPFGFYDNDAEFQAEADALVLFVKRKLGDDIISVELTKKQIWACFEESLTEFGSIVNRYQTKSQLATLIGQPTGSFATGSAGQSGKLPHESLEFLKRQAEPYAMEAGIGGSYDTVLCHFPLTANQQDYNIYTELLDSNDNVYYNTLTGSQRTKMKIVEVMHFSPAAGYRFFDTSSAINYLNNEFSFESYTPETIFYVLPVFEDILRAGMMDVSQRVRRSSYSYSIQGSNLRIFPNPTGTTLKNLYVRVMPVPDIYSPSAYDEDSLYGVTNLSNVPFGNIQYKSINSIGRQWARQYSLASAKELLGLIRSKFSSIPMPGATVELNGDALISQAKEEKARLLDELNELLDSLTYDKLALQEADKAENLIRQLKTVPVPLGKAITTG